MNKAWRLMLVLFVSMALQGQSLACSGSAIRSIGGLSASPPVATAGAKEASEFLGGVIVMSVGVGGVAAGAGVVLPFILVAAGGLIVVDALMTQYGMSSPIQDLKKSIDGF
jgi:hypothetical protein